VIENLKKAEPEQRERYLANLREQVQKRAGTVESTGVDCTLSWAAVAEMGQRGVRFGAHTQTHQILTKLPQNEARREVRASKAASESALSADCDTFAYPNGNWSPEIREMLADAGFELAVPPEYGAWTTACDRLAIPRVNICEDNVVGPTGRFSTI